MIDPDEELKLYDSRGVKFEIKPTPEMYYGNVHYKLDKFGTRGHSALNFRRKSFAVNVDAYGFAHYDSSTSDLIYYEKFKLLAMPFDYTYIENRLSHLILSKAELWPLNSFFTEIKFNNVHQGLYLFVESPDEHVYENKNALAIIRRYYNHEISSIEVFPSGSSYGVDYFTNRFNTIYELIKDFSGKQLYDKLNHHLHIDNYMRKMTIDHILANGDYTDEVFFYATENTEGTIYFDVIPWDYDDIFSSVAHEVGRSWAVGTSFGERVYNTQQDVLDELDGKIVFSIEDDLDYIIIKDEFLYIKYLENLNWTLSRINTQFIEEAFSQLQEELAPFYEIPEVSEQSKHDANETNMEFFLENLNNKKDFLLNRIMEISLELERQKSLYGI